MDRIELVVQTPCSPEVLESQVAASRLRGLPELQPTETHDRKLIMVAKGPTALKAPLHRKDTMALNGSLKLFTERGLAPTYWAACDPQGLVAGFLKDAPRSTTYLVASKCHPDVFEALKDRKVIVWHIDDVPSVQGLESTVPCATSITLCALSVARLLGYRKMETWGWDGCFQGGKDHAVPQASSGLRITNLVGSEKFATTPTWCAEAHDASLQIPDADYTVKIEGRGMIDAILKLQARSLHLSRDHQPARGNRNWSLAA